MCKHIWKQLFKKGYKLVSRKDNRGWFLVRYAHRLTKLADLIHARCICGEQCSGCGIPDMGLERYLAICDKYVQELQQDYDGIVNAVDLFCTRNGL